MQNNNSVEIVRLDKENLNAVIALAVETLRRGGIIAYPTETFYALGAKFDIEEPLGRLFELKGRPAEKALPLIVGKVTDLSLLVENISGSARTLVDKHWPGPLTILFPAKPGLSELITAEGKVAVRIPGESFALGLARAAGFPITATSANPSGRPPADDAETVIRYFPSGLDLVIDGGKTPGGLPSTLVGFEDGLVKVIREGAIRLD